MPPPDKETLELDALTNRLGQLTVVYEQYFSGGIPREPVDLVKRVEADIAALNRTPNQNTAFRFRLQGLMMRYTTLKQVWERRRRLLEGENPRVYGVRAKRGGDESVYTTVVGEQPLAGSKVNELFSRYLSVREQCGEPTAGFRPENFAAVLSENIAKIKQRTRCKSVIIKVEMHDKKARITAMPFD